MPHTPYDPNNIFARILRGELPCHRVYEDEHCLAFLDIMPQGHGHTLVIPKSPAVDLTDISPDPLKHLIMTVQHLAPRVRDAVGAEGFLILQFNGAAAGQTVFHIHFHIIPRWEGVALKSHGREMADPAELTKTAETIRSCMAA